MKLIDRYVLRSYLVPFIGCMLAFSMLFVIIDLFTNLSKFLQAQTGPHLIVTYYACMLLPSLEYIAPASSLLGTLFALWNFTRANELTAMRACGLSLYRIMVPFIVAGFAISLMAAVIKETLTPPALTWIENFKADRANRERAPSVIPLAYYNSDAHRQWLVDAFEPKNPLVLKGVEITFENDGGTRSATYTARRAEWLDGRWWLFSPSLLSYDSQDNPVGLAAPVLEDPEGMLEMPELTESPQDFVNEVIPWEFLTSRDMLGYLLRHPKMPPTEYAEKHFALHQRLALPWACFVVTIFGIPAGARTGRQNAISGIFAALGFFFAYYLLSHVGLVLGRSGMVQPWLGAWLSNVVFLFVGIVMMARLR